MYLVQTPAASRLLRYRCHEEELSRRAWWDRSLLSGGLKQCPSWLASCREDGCRGNFQASVWKQSIVCHVQRQLASVSPRLFRWSVPLGFIGGAITTWGRRLYRSWGRGSGLQSQADGTTTPIKIHSSTLYISTSGCFCYASPSRFTWWALFLF